VRMIVWSLVALTGWSCRSETQREPLSSASRFPCLSPDSGTIAYGDILVDSVETGDASGLQFTFQMHSDTLRGFVRDASGEIPS